MIALTSIEELFQAIFTANFRKRKKQGKPCPRESLPQESVILMLFRPRIFAPAPPSEMSQKPYGGRSQQQSPIYFSAFFPVFLFCFSVSLLHLSISFPSNAAGGSLSPPAAKILPALPGHSPQSIPAVNIHSFRHEQSVQVRKNACPWHSSVCNLELLSGRTKEVGRPLLTA